MAPVPFPPSMTVRIGLKVALQVRACPILTVAVVVALPEQSSVHPPNYQLASGVASNVTSVSTPMGPLPSPGSVVAPP